MADKHSIPKGNMHSNCRLLSDHIVCKIKQRNNIRRTGNCDPALKLLNEEIRFIVNYIKGRKSYTIYINHTSSQRQFSTGVPQGGVLSPTLFNIYTTYIPPPRAPVQVIAYAYDITITSTHIITSAAKQNIQPYLHKVCVWTKQTISHSIQTKQFALCSLQALQNIRANWTSKYKNTALPMAIHPKVLGLTLNPKLTYRTHIHNISVKAHKPLQMIKPFTAKDGVKRRRHSWLPISQSWDRLWIMPLPYGRLLHPQPALTNCKSCRMQHWELPQDAYKTQTYNICMTKHSYFPYTSTCSPRRHNANTKNNIHHTPYTNILQHSKAKKHYL